MDRWRRHSSQLCIVVLALGCNMPGREYCVAPAVSGVLFERGVPFTTAELRRSFRSRDVPTLGGYDVADLGSGGRFHFETASAKLAGQEASKLYFVGLSLHTQDGHRELWHQGYDRRQLPEAVVLRCELDPEARESKLPCAVE